MRSTSIRKDSSTNLDILNDSIATESIKVGDSIVVRRWALGREELSDATVIETRIVNKYSTIQSSDNGSLLLDVDERGSSNSMDGEEPNFKRFKTVNNDEAGDENQSQDDNNIIVQETLFYVHYIGMDRRLDEWIDKSKIVEKEETASILAENLKNGKTLTRSQRRIHEEFLHVPKNYDDMDAMTAKLEKEHEERTKVKNVELIQFGVYEIDAWYYSPFPFNQRINKIYFCEFCLWYTLELNEYNCHCLHRCKTRRPPGQDIYRDQNLAVFEVRGKESKNYCQSLCLLSKLFLDHKTLYYDVDGFLFYILCEVDAEGIHPVGHYSKELISENNLACIMVLPPYQRKGYGKLLIQLSYCLSEREGVIGTPEKPLSDLGKVSYRSYWCWVLLGVLDEQVVNEHISVGDLSKLSRIHIDDIIYTFNTLQLIKYWKGDHVVRATRKIIYQCKRLHLYHPPKLLLNPNAVRWQPTNKKD